MALDPYQSTHTGEEIDEGIDLAQTAIQPEEFNSALGLKANTAELGTAAYQEETYFATSAQGTKADNALPASSLPAAILAQVLTGISFASNAAIVAGDSVLAAFGKLQAQITGFISQVNIWSKQQRCSPSFIMPSSGTYTPNFDNSNFYYLGANASAALTANSTLANPTNLANIASGSIFGQQDATGGRVLVFGNLYKVTGSIPSAANARFRIDFVVDPWGNINAQIAAVPA